MIPNFFTENNEDRIKFVQFVQDNKDILQKILDEAGEKLKLEGEKFKRPHNQNQSLKDTLAFAKKNAKFNHVKTTYDYFTDMNLGDDPVRGELLYDLDSDEIHNDGFMKNPERRKQIREFEEWLNTENIQKELAVRTLNKSITPLHIANLKDNLESLSVRPMDGKDPGGLAYQKAVGKWEGFAMAEHDKKGGKKKRKKNRTKKKNRKIRRCKQTRHKR